MRDITGMLGANISTDEPEVKIEPVEVQEVEDTNEVDASSDSNIDTLESSPDTPDESESTQPEPAYKQSWKELRDKAERADALQRERDEALRMLQMAQYQQQYQQQQRQMQPQEEPDLDVDSLPDEEYQDNRTSKKLYKQQQKNLRKMQEDNVRIQQKLMQLETEREILRVCPDFANVVTDSNLAVLKKNKPHIFDSLSYNKNPFSQAVATYEALKDYGIYKDNNMTNKYAREDQQLAKNNNKPKPSATVPSTKKPSPLEKINPYGSSQSDMDKLYEDTKRKAGMGVY